MLEFLRKIFAYDAWATARSLESLTEPSNARALLLLSHVLIAEKIWILRLKGQDSSHILTFEEFPLPQCAQMANEINKVYAEYLASLSEDDLDKLVTYKNTKGVEFQTPIREILMHVGFHGAYHRGQIASLVRATGSDPNNTDFITFTRL